MWPPFFALVDVCLQKKHFKGKKVKDVLVPPPPKEPESQSLQKKQQRKGKKEAAKPRTPRQSQMPRREADKRGAKAKGGKKWRRHTLSPGGQASHPAEHVPTVWPVFSLEWSSYPFQPPSLIGRNFFFKFKMDFENLKVDVMVILFIQQE